MHKVHKELKVIKDQQVRQVHKVLKELKVIKDQQVHKVLKEPKVIKDQQVQQAPKVLGSDGRLGRIGLSEQCGSDDRSKVTALYGPRLNLWTTTDRAELGDLTGPLSFFGDPVSSLHASALRAKWVTSARLRRNWETWVTPQFFLETCHA